MIITMALKANIVFACTADGYQKRLLSAAIPLTILIMTMFEVILDHW